MRHDMSKIITEPARSGVGYYRTLSNDYRLAKRFKLDEDLNVNDEYCVRVNPIRSRQVGWDGKSVRLNYKTVNRFLTASVGRLWADVYSEIASICKTEAAKALNLRYAFTSQVETNTFVGDDGYIYYRHRGSAAQCAEQDAGTFYVDPRDGVLCVGEGETYKKIAKKRRAEGAAEAAKTCRNVDGIKFQKIDDVWFEVKIEKVRRDYHHAYVDVVTYKRTLSKAELRRYELN